jgi:3-hydroxyacyl-CoA dehydrogenase/enoyl-CoA hydratase/3-hydroxybutyryl-CoA epimerase
MSINLRKENNIAFLEFDLPDSKVNLLTAQVLGQLNSLLNDITEDSSLTAVVFQSKKKNVFIAGADIKEIDAIIDPKVGEQKAEAGQNIFNKIEDLKIPTIAVVDGVCLGGGCELILSCRYRIAAFNEKVSIGLPEVGLGIIPGFGGTYRMPRCVGLTEGLKMVVSGKPVNAQKALKMGLVDRLYPQKGLERSVLNFVEEIKKGGTIQRRKKKGLNAFLEQRSIGQYLIFKKTYESILENTKGFYPAPIAAVDVIKRSFFMDREDGLRLEAKTFSKLVVTDVSKNLVRLFYAMEKYKKLSPPEIENVKPKEIFSCGVLGAGVMGGGIAQLLSSNGIETRMKDINYDALVLGLHSADKVYQNALKRRRFKRHDVLKGMLKISPTLDYQGFQKLDMVIEAVIENMDVKKKVFAELSGQVRSDTVLCTNTSALSVTEMAQATKDPSKVIGLHFFNPVHRMPLVEIIKTRHTSNETLATTLNLVKRFKKTPIIVKDSCGFLVNRILLAYINEAGHILEEGGNIQKIDHLMLDFGMPMGPFLLSDEVGLDVGLKVLQILENGFGPRFKPVDIFEKVYENKLLGKKSGHGFYHHKGGSKTQNLNIYKLVTRKSVPHENEQDWTNRMIVVMINEAARCLEDNIIDEPATVDIGMIFGTGFPAFRGGLLRYADSIGISNIVEMLKLYETRLGEERFKPAAYLAELAAKEKTFYHG